MHQAIEAGPGREDHVVNRVTLATQEIIQLLSVFAKAFTVPTLVNAMVLLYGTILAPGRRTVAAALRAIGLANNQHFTNHHRVLNRARWSPWLLSRLLLGLIIHLLLPPGLPLLLVIDDTLERRRGPKIRYKGWFRDLIRSTLTHVSKSLPCLFGLFSLVVLMAKVLHPASILVRQTCWYVKEEATFIDALAAVRGDLWRYLNCSTSSRNPNLLLIPRTALFSLLQVACYST